MDANAGAEDTPIAADSFEENVEDLYEHASVGYVSSLPNGALVKVNGTLLSWTGYSREELLGTKRFHDLLAPGARIYYETHYAPLLQIQGSVREIAVELVCADGQRLPALLNSTLVRDADGTPSIIRTTVFNATERRRYERELLRARADAETRARAALALEHVNDGVLLVADDGTVAVVNAAAERILGAQPGTAVGRRVSEVVPEWESLVPRIPVGASGDRTPPAVLPLNRGTHEQWLAVAGVDAGEGVVYTIRDVSAERDLEQLRSDVVAIVSHEIRTPLTGAYGAAQTLLARYDAFDDGQRRQMLELIVEQTDRLARIVDQILLASRVDSGNVHPRAAAFEATEAIVRVLQALGTDGRSRVELDAEPALLAQGDAQTTAQVLTNLVDNALKYSDGPVRVCVVGEGATIRFTVVDHGPGIPMAERDRVFEKFYRLDPDLQRGVGGTGLGLYIAKELVTRMQGRIGILPRERGTAVFVDLPAAAAEV